MGNSSNIIQLNEYESASIGECWDADRKVVPGHVVAELERLQSEQRKDYFSISRRRIVANNYVGVVGVGKHAIEILPKTDTEVESARKRLIQMMSVAGIVPHLDAGIANLATSVPCLLDAFMQAYVRQLALEWRRGRISNYQKTDENRTCLRGKLLFQEQIRQNRLRPERFFTRADQFITDVPQSRLLKAGLSVCCRFATADATRRDAKSLLAEFIDVSNHNFAEAELDAVKTDRRIARFDPLLTMAKQFLRGCVPDRPGGASTYSLLFDMNMIFERFIGCLLRRAIHQPYHVQLQLKGKSLVTRNGVRKFNLRPDVAVCRSKEVALIIDTKWKLLDAGKSHEGVRQSDMYQAYAYAREYDCPRVILLYPRYGGFGADVAAYRLQTEDGPIPKIEIKTVDVAQPISVVKKELESMMSKRIGDGVSSDGSAFKQHRSEITVR